MGLTNETVQVPVVKKKVKLIVIAGVGVAAAVGVFFAYKRGYLDRFLGDVGAKIGPSDYDADPSGHGFDEAPLVRVADQVDFDTVPDNVRPNSYTTIMGEFKDNAGRTVAVPEGYYYVFEDSAPTGRTLRSQGSLGRNVSRFSQNIPSTNFRDGIYTVVVTDIPLPPQEIGPLSVSPVFGPGISPRGPKSDSQGGIGDITLS